MTPTLKGIRDVMVLSEVRSLLVEEVKTHLKKAQDFQNKELISYPSGSQEGLIQIGKMDQKELQGLLAQLDILANIETGRLLSPSENEAQIDFEKMIQEKQIVVFELPAANGDQSSRIGRMILGHLKSYMAMIESGRKKRPEFLPIYIDEFGAYASENFSDFLKQARSAKMAIHCFYQSLGDLENVSIPFMTQMMDNTLTKECRQDAPDSAEYWAKVGGTQDAVERSYQVGGTPLGFGMRTGMGNERLTKQMRIEHDVFKELRVFQMVLIEKNPLKIDAVNLRRLPDSQSLKLTSAEPKSTNLNQPV